MENEDAGKSSGDGGGKIVEIPKARNNFFTVFLKDYQITTLYLVEYCKTLNILEEYSNKLPPKKFNPILREHFKMSKDLFKKIVDNMILQKDAIEKLRLEWEKYLETKKDTK